MSELIKNAVLHANYFEIFLIGWVYFVLLYFGGARLFKWICQKLEEYDLVHKIINSDPPKGQVRSEQKYSFWNMFIFAGSVLAVVILIRLGLMQVEFGNSSNIWLSLVVLVLWNEVHFYFIHQLMHREWWMKKVHYVHHQSRIPTVYSAFSIHPIEAALLSTMPITIGIFFTLNLYSILLFPVVSIVFNFCGHCNYRVPGLSSISSFLSVGEKHNQHHKIGADHFGFITNFMDVLFNKKSSK